MSSVLIMDALVVFVYVNTFRDDTANFSKMRELRTK